MPITAQTIFVLLAGLILGIRNATVAVILWMLMGFLGLPVFAGASSGLAVLLGPTGGFMLGFIPMVALAGGVRLISLPRVHTSLKPTLFFLLLLPASLSVYLLGVPWLMWRMNFTLHQALMVGVVPFILGDLIKTFVAAFIYVLLLKHGRLQKL